MKKIILMCLFGLMFSQVDVSSKMLSYSMSLNGQEPIYISISDFIGSELERGLIQLVGFEGDFSETINGKYFTSETFESWNSGYWSFNLNGSSNSIAYNTYYFDNNIDMIGFKYNDNHNASATIHFIVTAEFPIEDTGYIEEGFDFCLHSGYNLVSFPCENPVSIETAIPENAQAELATIIGEGVASINLNGNWVGGLSDLSPGAGYWFKSNSNMCFNYTCAE